MLLHYIVLFLNILVVSAVKLTLGWGPDGRPYRGDVFWISRYILGMELSEKVNSKRLPCVVLDVKSLQHKKNLYEVLVLRLLARGSMGMDVVRAVDFFEHGATLQTGRPDLVTLSTSYNILYKPIYAVIRASSEKLKLYDGKLTHIPDKAMDRLVMISLMVDGWSAPQSEPSFGGVYWIMARFLGFTKAKIGVYIPCVVLGHKDENKYFAMRMSNGMSDGTGIPLPHGPAEIPKFDQQGIDKNHLRNYRIYFEDHYLVKGDPKIMQKMREDQHAEVLIASSLLNW